MDVSQDENLKKTGDGSSQTTVDSLQSKCDEYLIGWKRALADYDNLKKDLARERGEMRRVTTVELLLHLLPVMNNFEEATKHRPHLDDKSAEAWVSGMLMIKLQLEAALKELGAEPFEGIGEKFNPEIHESAGSRREEDRDDQVVLEVVRRGWKVDNKAVFPAKVIINSL
jgi:molecular chaperone GrpE